MLEKNKEKDVSDKQKYNQNNKKIK